MSSSSTSLQPFALRLVSIDYYLAKPAPKVDVSYAPLEGTSIEQVPVVRIFGSTPSGQKACVHLHKVCLAMQTFSTIPKACSEHNRMVLQAFPYFYVPYDDSFPDEPAQGLHATLAYTLSHLHHQTSMQPLARHLSSALICQQPTCRMAPSQMSLHSNNSTMNICLACSTNVSTPACTVSGGCHAAASGTRDRQETSGACCATCARNSLLWIPPRRKAVH